MPGAESVFLQGKSRYARVKQPDPDFDCWHITIYPDSASLEIIRELQAQGLKNNVKKDDDGWYVKFRRPTSKKYKNKYGVEQITPFDPPTVISPDGTSMTDFIGDGSDVTIKLEVYQHGTPGGGKAKAARLLSVRVDHLIPYVPKEHGDERTQEAVRDLDIQPKRVDMF